MNYVIITLIFQGFILAALVFLFNLWVKRQKNQLIQLLKAYFETEDPDEPSQFAGFVDIVSSQFASKLVSSIRAQLNQASGVISRQENQVEGAMAQDMLSQIPLAGAAMSAFPSLAKLIKKNPAIAGIVQAKIEEHLAKQMGAHNAGAAPAGMTGSNGGSSPLTIN